MKPLSALAACLVLSGCAQESYQIHPLYVSPMVYSKYTCGQLAQESMSVQGALNQAAKYQHDTHDNDQAAVTASALLFAPAAFLIAPHDDRENIGMLKGQYNAIQQVWTQKKCSKSKWLVK